MAISGQPKNYIMSYTYRHNTSYLIATRASAKSSLPRFLGVRRAQPLCSRPFHQLEGSVWGDKSARAKKMTSRFILIDDDTLKDLVRIDDDLLQLCKWLNEKRDTVTTSRLSPLVDELTRILIEAGKNKLQ